MYFCDTQQKQKQKNGKKTFASQCDSIVNFAKNQKTKQKRIKTKTNFQTNIKCIAEKL